MAQAAGNIRIAITGHVFTAPGVLGDTWDELSNDPADQAGTLAA
jgi:hypothetical protein